MKIGFSKPVSLSVAVPPEPNLIILGLNKVDVVADNGTV